MSTGNENLDLLIKLLNQTTNTNDNIALMAARKANEQLAKFGKTWEELLKQRITIVADPFATQAPQFQAKTAPPPMRGFTPPPPTPRPPPRPQPVTYLFVEYRSTFIGTFGSRVEAAAFISRMNLRGAMTLDIPQPSVYQTPHQFETNLRKQRAASATPPNPTAPVSGGFSSRKTNKFDSVCYTCSRPVPAGTGWLSHQTAAGKWAVVCGDTTGHNAKGAARGKRPQAGLDDLADLI